MVVRKDKKLTQIVMRHGKRLALITLAGLIWVQPVVSVGPQIWSFSTSTAHAASDQAIILSQSHITSGAELIKYQYTTTRSGKSVKVLADVIKVDLTNPYVHLDVMTGRGGQVTTRQSVQGMAKETGAVAGINGDFFSTSGQGVALGPAVTQGTLVTSPSQLTGMYAFAIRNDGVPIIDQYQFEGSVITDNGMTFPLSGINQEAYITEPDKAYSHANKMYIYTNAWKSEERPKDSSTTPTEVLVQGGVVQQISIKAPIPGAVPSDGYILRAHGTAAEFVAAHMYVGQRLETNYRLRSITSGEELNPSDLKMMVGGHTLLVDQGKPSSFTRSISSISGNSAVARTAIGYSKDGKNAYLIAVEKNNNSSGMTLAELQKFMVSVGVWKGINLDGGGSTTMVDRPLGETEVVLTFNPSNSDGSQRAVANGVGIYTTAPQGSLKALKVSGSSSLLIGQTSTYSLKGYDTYYNPLDTSSIQATWKSDNDNVVWTGEGFKGVKAGTSKITAISGDVKSSMDVTVIGGKDLVSLVSSTTQVPLEVGTSVSVPMIAKTNTGRSIEVPAESLSWEFRGMNATVSHGVLTVNTIHPGTKVAYAIAKYDGFASTPIVFSASTEQLWENFEKLSYPVSFKGLPSETTGKVSIVTGTERSNSKVLQLDYDFTQGNGNKFAYAELNGTRGKVIPEGSTKMSVDVYGDGSKNWLRAEFENEDGKSVYVDLAKQVQFTGWTTLTADLTSAGLSSSAKLKRLYLVNLEEGQTERSLTGSVQIDNIKFLAPASEDANALNVATVIMTIGQKTMTVNGEKKQIEVSPLLKDSTTYVPIRYVLDVFGGQAEWNAANKKITVLSGSTVLELTVNKKEFLLNGTQKKADVSPIIVNNRTLVPLRLVSEQLGINVKWEKKTKSITLES